jgi:arabinose-5-phosphate isomerase
MPLSHDSKSGTPNDDLASGRQVVTMAARALDLLARRLDNSFSGAVEMLAACRGRVVITGIGKSGHIARKLASTLSSTGTPAVFLHASEAGHGDLGFIREGDLCLIISKSGNNDELRSWLPFLRDRHCPIIAIVGNTRSWLADEADLILDASVTHEACPFNLAPTTSSTVAMVLGDALAIALLQRGGFSPEDFLRRHPSGVLGKRLSLKVADLMHKGEALPNLPGGRSLREALMSIMEFGLGMTCVLDEDGKLLGILTDGDIKRILVGEVAAEPRFLDQPVEEFISRSPRTVSPETLATEALVLMEKNEPSPITSLVVLDEQLHVLGVIHIHDILKAGLS